MLNPFLHLQSRKDLRDCCRNMLNLDVRQTAYKTYKATCRKCGRGHTRMIASGAVLGMMSKMEKHESGLMVPKYD